MKIEISFLNGRWLVNNKKFDELSHDEKVFMDKFFTAVREGTLLKGCDTKHLPI